MQRNSWLLLSIALVTLSCRGEASDACEELGIVVEPIESNVSFGRVVHIPPELDLYNPLVVREIGLLLEEHLVLSFPGLGFRLPDPAHHLEFTKQFGRVDAGVSAAPKYVAAGVHQSKGTESFKGDTEAGDDESSAGDLQASVREAQGDDHPEVFRVVTLPTDKLSFGEGWHTDLTFLTDPPKAAHLIARDVPPRGLGCTRFLDSRSMYDALTPELKEAIVGKQAVHTDQAGRFGVHPVARAVGANKERHALFVNRHFTRRILAEGEEPSANSTYGGEHGALLEALFAHNVAYGDSTGLKLCWEAGDLVMWYESTTQHAAVHDYSGYRREMHRVLLSPGENPLPSSSTDKCGSPSDIDNNESGCLPGLAADHC